MRADTSPSAERAMHCVCCVSYIVPLFLRLLCKLLNFAEKCTEREGLSSICSLQSLPSLTEMFDSFPCLMLTLVLSYSICFYTVTVAKGGTRVTCEEVEDRRKSLAVVVLGARNGLGTLVLPMEWKETSEKISSLLLEGWGCYTFPLDTVSLYSFCLVTELARR